MSAAPRIVEQAAAIPILEGKVCLITSRSGKRWILPKGCIETGDSAAETATREAWEEAGVQGIVHTEPVASYVYEKYGQLHRVAVFLLDVTHVAPRWPEAHWRQRRWLPVEEAHHHVSERALQILLAGDWYPSQSDRCAAS
jgi:8-oxo-dGTP pyrophosphatase MutT (NUDIX family)